MREITHHLSAMPPDLLAEAPPITWKWGRSYKALGTMALSRTTSGNSFSVTISKPYWAHLSEADRRDVVAHELAHVLIFHRLPFALARLVNQTHSGLWRDLCIALGGNGEAIYRKPLPPLPWTPFCPVHGEVKGRLPGKPRLPRMCRLCLDNNVRSPITYRKAA